MVRKNTVWGGNLKLNTGMKLCAGCLLEEDFFWGGGDQSDGHVHSLTGLQETHAEVGFSSSFDDCRNGYHIPPTATDTYLLWKKLKG